MKYITEKSFKSSYLWLHKTKASSPMMKKLRIVITRAEEGLPLNDVFRSLQTTAERRIPKCHKYILGGKGGGYRLVTVVNKGICIFLFCGSHDRTEEFIKKNIGKDFYINPDKANSGIQPVLKAPIHDESRVVDSYPKFEERPLTQQLSSEDRELLFSKFEYEARINIDKLHSDSSLKEIEVAFKGTKHIQDSDEACDILILLKDQRNTDFVNKKIESLKGRIVPLDKAGNEIISEAASSSNDQLVPLKQSSLDEGFQSFMQHGDHKNWITFMHPDQRFISEQDFGGPVRLKGVSGSGKTSVTINRAVGLSRKYKDEKILILTLNKPLARYIEDNIIDFGCENIEVRSLWELFAGEIIGFLDPNTPEYKIQKDSFGEFTATAKYSRKADPNEHIWSEFYRCGTEKTAWETMERTHKYLITRNTFPMEYIKEEFDYIRSHYPKADRQKYIEDNGKTPPRMGRSLSFDNENRKQILEGLEAWEKTMLTIGVTDYLNLTTTLYEYIEKIEPKYRCILIDEEQDFGSIELAIIRKMVKEDINDIFLTGDNAQRVYTKRHDLKTADINLVETLEIKKNYRNSKEILLAAYNVMLEKLTSVGDDEAVFEDPDFVKNLLEPEYAEYSGHKPRLCKAESFDDELTSGINYILNEIEDNEKYGCLVVAGMHRNDLLPLHELLKKQVPDIELLGGDLSFDRSTHIFLSDLEQTKGFEFDVVVIVGCSDLQIPNPFLPNLEHYKDLGRLYIAMTRAKTDLVVSFSHKKSSFMKFQGVEEYFDQFNWPDLMEDLDEYLRIESDQGILNFIRDGGQYNIEDGSIDKSNRQLSQLPALTINQKISTKETIPGFLYSREILGTDTERQNRLIKYITGDVRIYSDPDTKPTEKVWEHLDALFDEEQWVINKIFGGPGRSKDSLQAEIEWHKKKFRIGDSEMGSSPEYLTREIIHNPSQEAVTVRNRSTKKKAWYVTGKCRVCGGPPIPGEWVCTAHNPD